MNIENTRQYIEAKLLARYAGIGLTDDTGNGTPLANAAATLLAHDAVATGQTVDTVDTLSDLTLSTAAYQTLVLLSGCSGEEITFPFGTSARSEIPGSVTIDEIAYTSVAGHAGLVREDEAPLFSQGPNSVLLVKLIGTLARRLACHRLGEPVFLRIVNGADDAHVLRFAPDAGAGGVSLEYVIAGRPLEWLVHDQVHVHAEDVVRSMRQFWRQRKDIAAVAAQVRETASAVIDAHKPEAEPIALVGLFMRMARNWPASITPIWAEVSMFDHALRRGAVMEEIDRSENTVSTIQKLAELQDDRARSLARGDHNILDGLAAAIIEAASAGSAAILQRLKTELAVEVTLPMGARKKLVARLYWNHGSVDAGIYQTDNLYCWTGRLTLSGVSLPATTVAALPARQLCEVVELPFASPFPIHQADMSGDYLTIIFDPGHRAVDWDRMEIGGL